MRNMVRGALFDILRQVVEGSKFLDLFAGTGSVGLEALSRGAERVTFVDNYRPAIQLISKNLDKLRFTGRADVYEKDVDEALTTFAQRDRRFDVAFVGPPYGQGFTEPTLDRIQNQGIVVVGGILVAEVFKKRELPDSIGSLSKIKEENYGQNKLVFYRFDPPEKELTQA